MEPTSTWSHENDTTIATLSRRKHFVFPLRCGVTNLSNVAVANELEGRLTAVNPQPALLQASSASKAGTKGRDKRSERQERRNQMEKNRRERERHQLERITRLFKVASSGKPWSRKNALSLGEILFHGLDVTDHLQSLTQVSCFFYMAPPPSRKASSKSAPPLRPRRYPQIRTDLYFYHWH